MLFIHYKRINEFNGTIHGIFYYSVCIIRVYSIQCSSYSNLKHFVNRTCPF